LYNYMQSTDHLGLIQKVPLASTVDSDILDKTKIKLDRYSRTRYDTPQDRSAALHEISSIIGRFNRGLPASRTLSQVESVVQANGVLDEMLDEIVVIPIRDVPSSDARREIIDYIEKLQRDGEKDFSAGEIARILRLDLDIVLDVLDECKLL